MNYPSVDRIAALQQLIADFGKVDRALMLPGSSRRENDNDHSFGLALTCWYLQPKIAPRLDLGEIFKLALAHDLVELHAGDTFVFDEDAKKDKDVRERKALTTIQADWPDFTELSDYAGQYMDKSTEEARFVKAVDKLLAPIMIELSGKKEWDRLNISLDMEIENKTTIRVSDYVSPYYELLIEWLDQKNTIPKGKRT